MAQPLGVRRLLAATIALASVLTLAACTPGTGPIRDYAGLPIVEEEESEGAGTDESEGAGEAEEQEEGEEAEEPTGDEPLAVYLGDGGRIAVTIWGSSTCPVVPTEIRVLETAEEGNAVEFVLPEPDDGPCTADFVPHTTEFFTPDDVTTTQPLRVVVGEQEIEVPIK